MADIIDLIYEDHDWFRRRFFYLDQARTDGFDGEIDGFVAKSHVANQLLPTVELIRRRGQPAA